MPKEQIYHIPQKDKWEFDETVTDIFENMLQRSIPQYEVMRKAVIDIAAKYVVNRTSIVDLGCSRGETIALLLDAIGQDYCYWGIDISQPMIETVKKRFIEQSPSIKIEQFDLRRGYPSITDASVTLSILTLQFIPIEYRQQVVKNIYKSTISGGAFILIEKILGATADINALMTDLYYDLKSDNGYSIYEIERKRLSLEGVLVPVTARMNEEILRDAGFSQVDCFWRWQNFAGWLAIRD